MSARECRQHAKGISLHNGRVQPRINDSPAKVTSVKIAWTLSAVEMRALAQGDLALVVVHSEEPPIKITSGATFIVWFIQACVLSFLQSPQIQPAQVHLFVPAQVLLPQVQNSNLIHRTLCKVNL